MIEISGNVPFLWRLSAQKDSDKHCHVSMVVPLDFSGKRMEHTIETDVLSVTGENSPSEDDEILAWNEDDISLFFKLITSRASRQTLKSGDTIKVDLTDPETIEIVHIVAAAGFGQAHPGEDLILQSNYSRVSPSCEVGSHISLNTVRGFKRGVVVDVDEDDIACVILKDADSSADNQGDEIMPHDVLLVKRHQVLDSIYTADAPGHPEVLH